MTPRRLLLSAPEQEGGASIYAHLLRTDEAEKLHTHGTLQ